jgi:hypothetical protein
MMCIFYEFLLALTIHAVQNEIFLTVVSNVLNCVIVSKVISLESIKRGRHWGGLEFGTITQ